MKKLSLSLLLLTASSAFAMQSKLSLLIDNVQDKNTRIALNAIYDEMAQELSSLRKQLGLPIPYTKPSAATAAAPYYPPTAAVPVAAATPKPTPIASASAASGAAATQPAGVISPNIQRVINFIEKMNAENMSVKVEQNPTFYYILNALKLWKDKNENIQPAVQALKKRFAQIIAEAPKDKRNKWLNYLGFNDREGNYTFLQTMGAGLLSEQDIDDIYKILFL